MQDPAVMTERIAFQLGHCALAHRIMGTGCQPPTPEEFEGRAAGVHVYPHGGLVLHRHSKGINSFSWRIRAMVLPATGEGMKLIGPAFGSVLATFGDRERTLVAAPVAFRLRESLDRVCALHVEDLMELGIRRQVFFASLPDGKCLTVETLYALKDVELTQIEQGYLSIVNDGYFGEQTDRHGLRRLFWEGGERAFRGCPSGSDKDDIVLDLNRTGWVNVDDRCGLVFTGPGRALYCNRHFFPVWRAIEDALVLSLLDQAKSCKAGEEVAHLVMLWCPEQTHRETAREALSVQQLYREAAVVKVNSYLCACNFGRADIFLPGIAQTLSGLEPTILEVS
jgi:hypothetical protein